MAIIVFQHGALVGPGRLGLTLRDHGFKLSIRRLDLAADHPINILALEDFGDGQLIPTDFDNVQGVIALGGPQNVGEDHPWMPGEMSFLKQAHERQLPVIGICLGAQMIAQTLGGQVGKMDTPEIGMKTMSLNPVGQTEPLLAGIAWDAGAYETHGYEIKQLPPGATLLGSTKECKNQIFKAGVRTYGFQHHPEFDRAMIEALLPHDKDFCSRAGISEGDLRAQLDKHYADFARYSDRLCVNIASFLFPLERKLTA
ncbi:MAG: type 1 glutamine amidotransferase [Phycisphaeraceae bacterium]|nr:type 1 glutamine amidotransferase [Phycisphaeraceae bacterium]